MKNMTIWNIARACKGHLAVPAGKHTGSCPAAGMAVIRGYSGKEAAGIVIDSRKVEPGDIFVAIRGERVDGHQFIREVFDKGAIAVVCEEEPEELPGPCIRVEDSLAALRQIAAFYREQMPIPIVGITGSVGKTSTKEFVASVLAQKYKTHKTQGNFNNEIGVPLTLLAMPEDTEAAVVEMGINHFGEMHRLSEMVKPDICVMTNIGQCHLENLIDRDGILRAKSEIFDFMNPKGTVVVNGDDDKLATIHEVYGKAPVTFGMNKQNAIWADHIENRGLLGSCADIHMGDDVVHAIIPLPGEHMIYNAMAAAAVALQFGMSKEEIAAADLALVNQEVIIGGADLGITGYPSFNADFSLCDSLAGAGFDIICHATNHAMDKGRKGLINCAKYWKENYPQITVLGIHDTADTSTSCGAEPVILDLPDMKIAVLNYTYGTNGIPLPDDMPYAVDLPDGEQIVADIQRAEESADFFFVKHFFLKKRQNSPFSSREIPCFRWVIFIYTSLRMRACSIR